MTGSRADRGFTLMEVMMAFAILAAGASVMVAPLYRYGHRMDGVALQQVRNGVVAQQIGHLDVLNFDSLATRAGCTTVSASSFPHTRCITVTTISTTQKRVTLVVTPVSALLKPDTVIFDRTKPAGSNPFSLP